jgi:hypothetical protein
MYDQQPKKGVLSMATLHENTLKFNQKMTVTNTGGNLSTDAGLILVKEFLHSIGFE